VARRPDAVDDMCEYVHDNWSASPVHLSAYVLWRLNWIHPFGDGNGRTSRVVSYIVLCVRLGYRVPGKPTVPELIAADKDPYYDALDDADAHWREGRLNVEQMETVVSSRLAKQLHRLYELATTA
jgi:Fic family protein